MSRPFAPILLLFALLTAPTLHAATARDLSGRMVVDGSTSDFLDGEEVFGFNAERNLPNELPTDSQWGPDNDLNQIRITWDARFLYLAGEGFIWGNNMIILLDVLPGRGMTTMRDLNAWSRNFTFVPEFAPDLFIATWDGNTTPQLWHHVNGTQVEQQQVGSQFFAAATFSQNQVGRSMEFAIPWGTVFLNSQGLGTDTVVVAPGDTVQVLPATTIRIAGVITAGPDNTGGPDSAPDNTRGHTSNSSDFVVIDNFAIVSLDEQADRPGFAGPDSVADFGATPLARVSYRPGFEPPIIPVRLDIDDVVLERPAFKPDLGDVVRFDVSLDPRLDASDPANLARTVVLSAVVYDLRGRRVRRLYTNSTRSAIDPTAGCLISPGLCDADPLEPDDECSCIDRWDGRDDHGQIVPPGVYILSVQLEPAASRKTRAVVVVR